MDNLFSPLNLLVATTAITVLPHSKPRFQKIWPYPVIALIGSAIAAIFLWANGQLNYRFLNVSAFIPVYLIAGSAIVYTINNYLVVKKNNLPSIPLIVFSVSVFWIGFASIQSNSASRHAYQMGELNERKNALSSSEKILDTSGRPSELEQSDRILENACAIFQNDYGRLGLTQTKR